MVNLRCPWLHIIPRTSRVFFDKGKSQFIKLDATIVYICNLSFCPAPVRPFVILRILHNLLLHNSSAAARRRSCPAGCGRSRRSTLARPPARATRPERASARRLGSRAAGAERPRDRADRGAGRPGADRGADRGPPRVAACSTSARRRGCGSIEDLSYREIAEQMGLEVPAVRTHVSRALRRLSRELRDAWTAEVETVTGRAARTTSTSELPILAEIEHDLNAGSAAARRRHAARERGARAEPADRTRRRAPRRPPTAPPPLAGAPSNTAACAPAAAAAAPPARSGRPPPGCGATRRRRAPLGSARLASGCWSARPRCATRTFVGNAGGWRPPRCARPPPRRSAAGRGRTARCWTLSAARRGDDLCDAFFVDGLVSTRRDAPPTAGATVVDELCSAPARATSSAWRRADVRSGSPSTSATVRRTSATHQVRRAQPGDLPCAAAGRIALVRPAASRATPAAHGRRPPRAAARCGSGGKRERG